jgi:type II secretory pathway component PulM
VTKATREAIKPKPRVSFALQADDRRSDEQIAPISPRRRALRNRRWIYASATLTLVIIGLLIWQMLSKEARVEAAPPPALPQSMVVDADLAQQASDVVDADDAAFECVDVEVE